MNAEELKRNPQLTEWAVQDLNADPRLPYESDSFDAITNAVSVDYLTKPQQVFQEMHRCLKPGGLAIMSFSNRCFPTKGQSQCAPPRASLTPRPAGQGWVVLAVCCCTECACWCLTSACSLCLLLQSLPLRSSHLNVDVHR